MKDKYLVVIERANDGSFSAYVPDLPGCTSCADTEQDVRLTIREAIELYIEELTRDGRPIPQPTTRSDYVDLPAA